MRAGERAAAGQHLHRGHRARPEPAAPAGRDRQLTYVGFSYGTAIGQTYENLFPRRVRAMTLDGFVNPVEYTASAERPVANQAGAADGVFFCSFVRQCQRAGPSGCALAGHSESVARRIGGLFARVRRAPIPAPHAKPPGVLDYSHPLLSTFNWSPDGPQLRLVKDS